MNSLETVLYDSTSSSDSQSLEGCNSESRLMKILYDSTPYEIVSPTFHSPKEVKWETFSQYSDISFLKYQGFDNYLDFINQDEGSQGEWLDYESENLEDDYETCSDSEMESWGIFDSKKESNSDHETSDNESDKDVATQQK